VKFSLKIFPLSFVLLSQTVNAVSEKDDLPTLIVSASRSDSVSVPHASSIKVISREEIELSGAKSIPELLRGQPGVYVSDFFGDGSNASIDMRGFGSTANANTLIMIDGRKLNFATDSGTLYFNAIDLDNVEQVEITQGSAGVLFGNMAVGGVINIITRKPTDDVIEASLDIGSYNSHKERIRLENLHANGWSSRLVLINKESDNYRDHNDAETSSASLRLDKRFESGRFFAEYEYLDDYIQTPGALFLDEIALDRNQSALDYANDYQDLKSQVLRLATDYSLSEQWLLEGEISYQDADREFVTSYRGLPGGVSLQDRIVTDLNTRLIYQQENIQIISGIDVQLTDYSLISSIGLQSSDLNIASIYADAKMDLDENLIVSIGMRYAKMDNQMKNSYDLVTGTNVIDDYDIEDDITIGSAGIVYIQDHARYFARVDQNYRFPKVEEHTNTVTYEPNGLQTQTSLTYEIGAEFNYDQYSFNGNLYWLDIDDEISYDFGGFTNLNLDSTRRKGFSIAGDYSLSDDWIIGAGYDFIDAEITSGPFSGNTIPEVPENLFSVFTEYQYADNLSMRMDAYYIDNRYYGGDFDNNYSQMNAYSVFNFSSLYEADKYSLSFRMNNIFDKKYSEYGAIGYDENFVQRQAEFTSPERNLWLGVKVNLSD